MQTGDIVTVLGYLTPCRVTAIWTGPGQHDQPVEWVQVEMASGVIVVESSRITSCKPASDKRASNAEGLSRLAEMRVSVAEDLDDGVRD